MTALIRHPLIRGLAALSAFGLAVLITVYSLVPASQAPAPSVSDKVKHFAAYAALAAPLWVALGPGMRRAATAFALAVLFGIGLELAQMLGTAGREGSALDVAANMGGAVAGLACVWIAGRNWPLFCSDSG